MKTGFAITLFIVLLAFAAFHRGHPWQFNYRAKSACDLEIEKAQEVLFPTDTWIETEARILSVAQMLGIKFGKMEGAVAYYQVARATAAEEVLWQANRFSSCLRDSDEITRLLNSFRSPTHEQ